MMKALPFSMRDLPDCPEAHLYAAQTGEEETMKSECMHVHGEEGGFMGQSWKTPNASHIQN